jgi:hypothetical protein
MSREKDRHGTPSSDIVDSISRRSVLKKTAAVSGGAAILGTAPATAASPCTNVDPDASCGQSDLDSIIYKTDNDCFTDCGNNNESLQTASISDSRFGISYLGREGGDDTVYKFALSGSALYYEYADYDTFCNSDYRNEGDIVGRNRIQDLTIDVSILGKTEPATQVDAYRDAIHAGLLEGGEVTQAIRDNWGDTSQDICDLQDEFDKGDYDPDTFPLWAAGVCAVAGGVIGSGPTL